MINASSAIGTAMKRMTSRSGIADRLRTTRQAGLTAPRRTRPG
jgi:hypothetical protein